MSVLIENILYKYSYKIIVKDMNCETIIAMILCNENEQKKSSKLKKISYKEL